ncbi:RNA polymerase Rpb7-like domain-containing protein [Apiospora phragmitis]|uniref:DNA-directed RNA polymerase subunit n=1 Tax=Apiospora phragmitis TaxID=2905665 RepID=A0ABR1VTL4_9PEZI
MAAEQTKTKAKREHKSKKRIREGQEDIEGAEVQRKHKRSKSEKPTAQDEAVNEDDVPDQQSEQFEADEVEVPKKKCSKEDKDKKKKKKKDKHSEDTPGEAVPSEPTQQQDEMDIDEPAAPSATGQMKTLPKKPFPFFRQTVSRYLPLFPAGMVEPIDGYAEQHLKPLLNRYVREFKGVLLAYRNVRLGEAPNRGSLTEKSEMGDQALLETIDEYAAGFGWLTAEVDLFKPSRGAPLEGVLNMATEGHLGVVCWGMFNAAIEASRLPKGWNWVSTLSKNRYKEFRLPTPEPTEEGQEQEEVEGEAEAEGEGGEAEKAENKEGDVTQLYSTGYWADADGQKVEGTIQFRIKSFEVGQSGEYGYLSIEGTMLDADEEAKQVAEELERKRRRDLRSGGPGLWRKTRFLPDFSVTKFGADEEDDQEKRAEVWKEGADPQASRLSRKKRFLCNVPHYTHTHV